MPNTMGAYVESICATMAATHLAAPSLDWSRICGLRSAAEQAINVLARVTGRLSMRHAKSIGSLEASEELLASVPPSCANCRSQECSCTPAPGAVTPHEPLGSDEEEQSLSIRVSVATETVAFLEGTLHELNPAFPD